MKLIENSGSNRVIDTLREAIAPGTRLDIATPFFSLFAFSELLALLKRVEHSRVLLSPESENIASFLGSRADRPFRNRLQVHWLARKCAEWLQEKAEVRQSTNSLPQSTYIVKQADEKKSLAIIGNCPLTTDGLGLTPGNQFGLIQSAEKPEESALFESWFDSLWKSTSSSGEGRSRFLSTLQDLGSFKAPSLIYHQILSCLFKDQGEGLDEEKIVKSSTGIKQTKVWNKLYKFQRDGVIGAIDKLERMGGCILADSVGLGKTFEALAVIKYYELRNDRVLVLVPKRLRDNWTLYKANDRRNILASDRFNYDVLNHTDLSRESGHSGDIDLSHLNWGNYDLIVIDESHNFRNKISYRDRESRYDRLMRRIIKEGVKTRVLMLSATPVNNRLTDLRNQIAFITEGKDNALSESGIPSINTTILSAQKQFSRWLELEEEERSQNLLVEMLGFDYFQLLDLLTIARSRKHIEKYYGTKETGKFPERLKPVNFKPNVDSSGHFPTVKKINDEIRRLHLAAYAPLRYVLPHKEAAYDKKYSMLVRGGTGFFRQVDREESLVQLLRVNVLKRMESAVTSFALTVKRQLDDVETTLGRIEDQAETVEEIDIAGVDIEDPAFEPLLVGRKVKVLLQDMDLIRWRQDLVEDRDRLEKLYSAAMQVDSTRDAKLEALKEAIYNKATHPINAGNRKVLVFTAFADTAAYLYDQLAPWAQERLGVQTALVTGTGANQTTIPNLRRDLSSILTAFSPRSKERPEDLSEEGELDLLIATDCISEGQNLQDCDTLINYDIHWNPVRIIQRFGRIDRIGSINTRIQLINFWPNMELEEYIKLEQRVSGRMVLLDVSATGEENLIEQQSGNQMNDLEYRRKQLLKLQDAVIDLEDLGTGISITDMNLSDFRIDLAEYLKGKHSTGKTIPLGAFAVVTTDDAAIPPGVIFCVESENGALAKMVDPNYPLDPYYLVHVTEEGETFLPYPQARAILERLKRLCEGKDVPESDLCARFEKTTKNGEDMSTVCDLLAAAVSDIAGKSEEHALASLFSPGGTTAIKGEFAGMDDFEVVTFLVVLPEVKA